MGEALTLTKRGFALWNAQDMDAIVEDWSNEIVVRPDPYFPDSDVRVGKEAARQFWQDQADAMGFGRIEVLEEHDLGIRCLIRIRQHVEARASGVEGSYDWSLLATVREGKLVMYEFFLDRERGRAAAGLS